MPNVLEIQQGIWLDEQILRRAGVGAQWQVLVQPGEIRILPVGGGEPPLLPDDQPRGNWTAPDALEQMRLLRQIHEELTPYAARALQIALEEEEDWEALLG